MFSLGWMEISIILIILIVLVGPKELPKIIRTFKSIMKNIRALSRDFTDTLSDVTDFEEIKNIKEEILDTKNIIKKEGNELDEFIDKNNKNILDKENKDV